MDTHGDGRISFDKSDCQSARKWLSLAGDVIEQVMPSQKVRNPLVCVCGVLKVSESCGFVFLDGSESRGSSSASIIVKYGRHARFIQFRVWIPELPLDVEVSDARLGRFIGWQVLFTVINATELTTA